MSKTKEQDVQTEATDAKVEIPLSEFEEMKAQIALLTKQAASDNRMKTEAERRAAEDEKVLEQVRAANEAAQEEVELFLSEGSLRSNKNAEVSINGVQYIVPKGQVVRIKKSVEEIINNSIAQRKLAYGLQDEKAGKSKFDNSAGAIVVSV